MIYLNVAGLSPFKQAVQQEVTATFEQFSRLLYSDEGIHYYRKTVQCCRQQLAQWLQVEDAQNIAFVPNATTASWLVLSRINWKPGDQVLTTTHENSTVLREILALQTHGVHVHTLDSNSPNELEAEIEHLLVSTQVRAIVISHVSHIDGRIFPIERIYQLTQNHRALLIVDGAQAVGHIPVSFHDWQPDAYFFPGHKWCGGPMGTGALILGQHFLQQKVPATPNQKWDVHPPWIEFELGTQNIGLLAGLAKACNLKNQEGLKTTTLETMRQEIRLGLSKISALQSLEWDGPHTSGILSFTTRDPSTTPALLKAAQSSNPIIWKAFPLPTNTQHTGIRLSWGPEIPRTVPQCILRFLERHFE